MNNALLEPGAVSTRERRMQMNFIILAALAASTAIADDTAKIGPGDWIQVAESARKMNVSPDSLYMAMTTRETPRPKTRQVRYCVPRAEIVAGKSGMVCRTRTQWASFGLEVPSRDG
ncbi:MAG: hypothetical protein C0474_03605 [Sphingobium sp.]|nr:hypothetical protein [Sphingobium sp.]